MEQKTISIFFQHIFDEMTNVMFGPEINSEISSHQTYYCKADKDI